jgi:hypothetical protein
VQYSLSGEISEINEGRRRSAGGRRQEGVFVTGIYAPLQKLFALKGEVLDPIFSINPVMPT